MKQREKKKQAKKQRKEHFRLQIKQQIEHTLVALKLLKGFQALPARIRGLVIQAVPATPKICIEPAGKGCPGIEELKGEIEGVLKNTYVQTKRGGDISLSECFSTLFSLTGVFAYLVSDSVPGKHKTFIIEANDILNACFKEGVNPAMSRLATEILIKLLRRSRPDKRVYGCVLNVLDYFPGKPMLRLTLSSAQPREDRVGIDGKVRPVFQLGVTGIPKKVSVKLVNNGGPGKPIIYSF